MGMGMTCDKVMGPGTGTRPKIWVRVQDVKSRMKDCGYNYYSYATLYLGTCIGTGTTSLCPQLSIRKNLSNIVSESRFVNKRASMNPWEKSLESDSKSENSLNLGAQSDIHVPVAFPSKRSFGDGSHKNIESLDDKVCKIGVFQLKKGSSWVKKYVFGPK